MKRHWKIIVTLIVVLPIILAIWMAMMRSEGQNAVDNYRKSLIAKGEKFEIAELVSPSVPPEQNGADTVSQAFGMLIASGFDTTNYPYAMRLIAPAKAIVGFRQPDVRSFDFTNNWPAVMTFAAYNRPATELLRRAMNFSALDFHLNYSLGPELRIPHVNRLSTGIQRLSAEAMCDLHNGDAASAATNIYVMLALANGEQNERLLITQIIRRSNILLAANDNWELLQSTNLNDAELAMLQKSWERLEFVAALENAFLMERASFELDIKRLRTSRDFDGMLGYNLSWRFSGDWSDNFDEVKGHLAHSYAVFMWHASWTYSDELQTLQNLQIILETLRTIQTNGCFDPAYTNMVNQLDAANMRLDSSDWDNGLKWMFSGFSSGDGKVVARIMEAETAREIVITAIALKRYQLKYGKYPQDLKSLAPEFVAVVPPDPIDGQPLRYRLNGDGTFLLYSIGPDGKDDGGDAANPKIRETDYHWLDPHNYTWLNLDAPDWVWPQPATPTETQYFYEHPPNNRYTY